MTVSADSQQTNFFTSNRKSAYELADIFELHFDEFARNHKLSYQQRKAINAIRACRTQAMGGHIRVCSDCNYSEIAYNSCRNRHCPKCQYSKKLTWVEKRMEEILPIPYYHQVFTMPHLLNDLCLCNKEIIYNIFFKAAADTINAFARDPKYLGAKIGFTAILHTWGQSLCYHVHLHMIVAGGGISNDGNRWKALPYREKFLFPVKAMSKVVAGKFIQLLKEAYQQHKLTFPGKLKTIDSPHNFNQFLNAVAKAAWINYAKKPFAGPQEVINYIGNYTHKVAIANQRITALDQQQISFRYKDYKDNRKNKIMTLNPQEFIRRFLLHILPKQFQRIRHYGFLANGGRKEALKKAAALLSIKLQELTEVTKQIFLPKCPICKENYLEFSKYIRPDKIVAFINTT